MDVIPDPELRGKRFQRRLQRPFARDQQFRPGIIPMEKGESAQAGCKPFFWNQAAGLEKFPAAFPRRLPPQGRKLRERNSGAIDPDFLRRTTELDEAPFKRARARQNERHRSKDLAQFRRVIGRLGL
jgi:hypothetical protein